MGIERVAIGSKRVAQLHFRCGRIASREGSSRFIFISRVRVSRIRRYTVSCSFSVRSADGGSSSDQRRCRPAPEVIGQVSVRPLQRIIPSSTASRMLGERGEREREGQLRAPARWSQRRPVPVHTESVCSKSQSGLLPLIGTGWRLPARGQIQAHREIGDVKTSGLHSSARYTR